MKDIYLICNAHLDPVWQWEWEEGAAEALSTFRIAAKFCRQYDGYVFNHNEALLYKWVEEYEPELFKEIQALVKEGKWHIMGGWYLQPDCNMPSGEAFVRQIKAGREYFLEKFNVFPTTALNFDSFGHNRGLVQIMKKSGYDSYLFMRPSPNHLDLPDENFKWIGFDGSEIYARRTGSYSSHKGRANEKIQRIIDATNGKFNICLWGIGNHGGGPSKKDLDMIYAMEKDCKAQGIRLIHATPEKYFGAVEKENLPEYKDELNLWAPGCYTSVIRIKQEYRALENMLFITEAMCANAEANGFMEYPEKELIEAAEDMLKVQFHDVLPGTLIKDAEEASLRQLAHGKEILSKIKMRAFMALASGQEKASEDKIPIMVYNPYPYEIEGDFSCEMMLWGQNWAEEFSYPEVYYNGKKIPTQCEKERSTLNLDWRKKVTFHAKLQPMQMNRFDCAFKKLPSRPKAVCDEDENYFILKNKRVVAKISKQTGFLESYQVNGKELIKGACALNVFDDNEDPWGMYTTSFNKKIGEFKLMSEAEATKTAGIQTKLKPIHPIESGKVRTTIEAMFKYKNSKAVLQYTLSEFSDDINLSIRVNWAESQKMIKLVIPTALTESRCFGQVAYGVQEFTKDIRENCGQKYVMLTDKENTVALINNGTYGFSKIENTLCATLLRSAVYCAHPLPNRTTLLQDRYMPHMEQGERYFEFILTGGNKAKIEKELPRKAMEFNMRPMALSVYPKNGGKKPVPFVTVNGDKIEVSAIKKASDKNGYIIRIFNPFNKKAKATLNFNILEKEYAVSLTPYEIKTVKVGSEITETDLLEREI